MRDYAGRLSGLYLDGDKVRAREFHVVNEAHWPLLRTVETDPAAFGMSIDADGDTRPGGNGLTEVTRLTSVNSVDVVSAPAANRTMFESADTGEGPSFAELEAAWRA